MSVCRVQIRPVRQAPHIAIELNIGVRVLLIQINSAASRSNPYLPSFKRIAARIIEPATGASTCALGSHKCIVKRGIFTIKAAIVMSHHRGAIV